LQHPNIVKVFETFESPANFYIVLELCTGGTLSKDVQHNGAYTEAQAFKVISQLLAAVKYMHNEHKISHRDLKPDNVLYLNNDKDLIKVVDFGFSKDTQKSSMKNTLTGTLDYCAPEVINQREYNYLSIDMWSVGCILYELLFGHPPFHEAKTFMEVCMAATKGVYSLERTNAVPLSEEIKAFIKTLLCVDSTKRATAAEASQDPWILSNRILPDQNQAKKSS